MMPQEDEEVSVSHLQLVVLLLATFLTSAGMVLAATGFARLAGPHASIYSAVEDPRETARGDKIAVAPAIASLRPPFRPE